MQVFLKYKYNVKKNMYVHSKCIVPNDWFKCKYIVIKAT